MRRWALVVALIAAICGAVLAGVSTSQHFRIQREGLEEESFCVLSETINCDVVNASSYSEFLGVPIAWWGLLFYLIVGGMLLVALVSKKDRRATVMIAWLMSLGGILYSAFLSYISFFVLEVLCIECLGMYLVNILFVIFLFVALKVPLGNFMRFIRDYVKAAFDRPSNLGFKPQIIKHAVIVAIVYIAGWAVIANVQAKDKTVQRGGTVDEKVKAYYMQSEYPIEVDESWAVWGNPNAKVTIVEFSEYQCPFCRLAAFGLKPYLQEFKDDIRYYFVNYPLDSVCNEKMTRPMHPMACFAAKAGICAGKRGAFWSFHDELFRNQRKLSKKIILGLAEERGWNVKAFEACIDSAETDAQVRKEIAAANKIFVTGTPSVFLNNRKVKYWRDSKFLQRIVKEEIKKAKKKKK